MSLNYLEIARVAEALRAELPLEVWAVELIEWPLPDKNLPDLSLGVRLSNRKTVAFSLKSPWVGLFYGPSPWWKPVKGMAWNQAFGRAEDFTGKLKGTQLERVEFQEGERRLFLEFSGGHRLRMDLFSTRPNWVFEEGPRTTPEAGRVSQWKPDSTTKPMPRLSGPSGVAVARELRDFGVPEGGEPWLEAIYRFYIRLRQEALLAREAQAGLAALQARITKLIKLRGQLQEQLTESERAEEFRIKGETIKSHLHELPKNHRLPTFEGIELDSKVSVADNVTRFFSRYKKLKRTQKEVEIRLSGIEQETKKLTSAIASIRAAAGPRAALAAAIELPGQPAAPFGVRYSKLREALRVAGLGPAEGEPLKGRAAKDAKKWEKTGLRSFRSKDGFVIWAGRNHEENEELVIRLARGNDLWMHLKGKPGAHVIVQLPAGKSPSLETLLDAASVVAYFSNVHQQEKVEVDYTFRKYVKRVPGRGEKFLVTYTQNKTLVVKMEQERMNRLFREQL